MTVVRTAGSLFLGFALLLGAAACGKSADPNAQGDPSASQPGGGQIGDESPSPSPTPEVTATPGPTAQPSPGPTPSPGFTLHIPPDVFADLLSWPSPADCDTYNPDNLTISAGNLFNQFRWRVMDGQTAVLTFRTQADADQGLALAKSFKRHCYVGRGASRTMDYWLDQVSGAPSIPSPSCVGYNPDNLTVNNALLLGWQVKDGSTVLTSLSSQADANNAKKVMSHYNRKCTVGTNYSGDDKADFLVDYFAKITFILPSTIILPTL